MEKFKIDLNLFDKGWIRDNLVCLVLSADLVVADLFGFFILVMLMSRG